MTNYEINQMTVEELEKHIERCKELLMAKKFDDFWKRVSNVASYAQELWYEYPNCYLVVKDRHTKKDVEVSIEDLTFEDAYVIEELLDERN